MGAFGQKIVSHCSSSMVQDEESPLVHMRPMEGFWSLLRSRLRPHRGISQEKLPLYLGFFEFVHNARRLILDSRVVIGQAWRNRLFLQAFNGGRDRCGVFGKSRLISSA